MEGKTVAGRLILPANTSSAEITSNEICVEPLFKPKILTTDHQHMRSPG